MAGLDLAALISRAPAPAVERMVRRSPVRRLLDDRSRIAAWNRLGCRLDPGCYVGPLVVIHGGREVAVGRGSALSGRVELAAWAPISIGENVMINSDTHLLTGSHDINDPDFLGQRAAILIEDNAWVGQGAAILRGVRIGEGGVVGAYAVVTHDVAPRSVVAGNPARVVGERRRFRPAFVPADFARHGVWRVTGDASPDAAAGGAG